MTKLFFLSIGLLLGILACSGEGSPAIAPDQMTGAQLADAYCAGCHLPISPGTLPKSAWQTVLPEMGNRLGILTPQANPYRRKSLAEQFQLKSAGVFPEQPVLSDSAWNKLVTHFIENAPDSLSLPIPKQLPENTLFEVSANRFSERSNPMITLLDAHTETSGLWIGTIAGELLHLDASFQIIDTSRVNSPPIYLTRNPVKQHLLVGSIGILTPNDQKTSSIQVLDPETKNGHPLVRELGRLVHFTSADLNRDDLPDLITCEFGHYTGALSWYEQKMDGQFQRHPIKQVPGALKTILMDTDEDGDTDILALFGQGDEGISLFLNDQGQFTERKLLRFPAVHGSSDFELRDMDQDGDLDLVLTNGDNGDYSYTLKPFHGVRIYQNQGNWEFTEVYFHPMHGASKVRVADFDGDQDQDMLVISFYPDFVNGLNQSILYFEQQAAGIFQPQQFSMADQGRWMVMDTGDIDGDGDIDAVIGSFVLNDPVVPKQLLQDWQKSGPQILVLKNKSL